MRSKPSDGAQETLNGIVVPLWDLPVRLSHWMLAVLFGISLWTSEYGHLELHRWSGYTILGLVLFRIYWGFVGTHTARFHTFIRGPRAVWSHCKTLLKRGGGSAPGHTPLGGWSILAMLTLLLLQCALGLFAVDVDGIESGPLADLVSFGKGRSIAHWHSTVANVLILLVVLHLTAILHYSLYKRDNLIPAMWTGGRRLTVVAAIPNSSRTFWRALIGIAIAAIFVAAVVTRLR